MPHSPVLPTGLTANGVDLTTTDLKKLFRIVTGGPEDNWVVRGDDTTIPTSRGRFPRNRVDDLLVIVADGFVQGDGVTEALARTDFLTIRLAIRALMVGTQDPYTLVHTDESGNEWSIQARPRNVLWSNDDSIPAFRRASLEWVAVEDDWEATGS